jgi:hypothetical protein
LCQSLHDLPDIYGTTPAFLYGESDEETLLKGGGHCSCKARLLCSLCQIAGLEARPVFLWVWFEMEKDPDAHVLLGGHSVNEILIDGEWGFFDPECHVYCQTPDGRVPSIREIRRSPDLFAKMSESLKTKMNPRVPTSFPAADIAEKGDFFGYYAYRYFSPIVPTSISRHEVNDADATIRWNWATDQFREQQTRDFKTYKRVLFDLARRGELTDEIYQLRLDAFRERFGLKGLHLPSLLASQNKAAATPQTVTASA